MVYVAKEMYPDNYKKPWTQSPKIFCWTVKSSFWQDKEIS